MLPFWEEVGTASYRKTSIHLLSPLRILINFTQLILEACAIFSNRINFLSITGKWIWGFYYRKEIMHVIMPFTYNFFFFLLVVRVICFLLFFLKNKTTTTIKIFSIFLALLMTVGYNCWNVLK